MNCKSTEAEYYCITTARGPLHIHINYDDNGPVKLFVHIPPVGSDISTFATLTGILVTKYLAIGGDIKTIIKHLGSITSGAATHWEGMKINSIPHAISVALRLHLEKEQANGTS